MITIYINGCSYLVKNSLSILEACKIAGISIKRFCYHESLPVAGNCRMCLVEIENNRKIQASCVTKVLSEMRVYTDTPYVQKLRENIMESLLINHPLDCPICDQGGECDLQDQAVSSGKLHSKYFFKKREVEDKNIGFLVKTVMTRCIQCTRCVRYSSTFFKESSALGTLGRGNLTQIGFFKNEVLNSEVSGNIIDLCPVGALTSKQYSFKFRPWELNSEESIDLFDSLGSNIYFNFKQSEIVRVLPKLNKSINNSFISDKVRFFFDSLQFNRVKNIYYNKPINLRKKKKLFLIDDTCSTEQVISYKKLNYKYPEVSIARHTSKLYNNLYIEKSQKVNFFFKNIVSNCLIISSNLRFENAILNTKIRIKYNNYNFDVWGVFLKTDLSFPINFFSFNVDVFCKLIEGKVIFLSKFLLQNNLSIIISNYSELRFSNNLFNYFKIINSNLNILTITLFCNSEGLDLLNVKPIVLSKLKNKKVLYVNLDDTYNTRRFLFKEYLPSLSLWLNSFGSFLSQKMNVIIPIESIFEIKGTFFNLEGRPQQTISFLKNKSFEKMFLFLIFSKYRFIKTKINYLNYNFEILNNPVLFELNNFFFSKSLNNNFFKKNIIINKTFFKSSIEDFYCNDLVSRNSKVLINCSKELRKLSKNFE
jgi:NADH-quinone oxidoreductase subunit G